MKKTIELTVFAIVVTSVSSLLGYKSLTLVTAIFLLAAIFEQVRASGQLKRISVYSKEFRYFILKYKKNNAL